MMSYEMSYDRELREINANLRAIKKMMEKAIADKTESAASAAAVVRCRGCIYFGSDYLDGARYYFCRHDKGLNDPEPDYFCPHAEQKGR